MTRGARRVARLLALPSIVAVASAALAASSHAQPSAASPTAASSATLARALDAEGTGKSRDAAVLFRRALTEAGRDAEQRTAALLGLERVLHELGQVDSLLPLIEPAVAQRPRDPTLRTIQLRTLRTLGRDDAARAAFDAWRRTAYGEAAPYREYARLLLQAGRAPAADSVLQLAQRSLGRSPRVARELALEVAQLHASLGRWEIAGSSWRDALDAMPYVEQAAVMSLQPAPDSARDSVVAALLAPPEALVPRRAASTLLLAWRKPRAAWDALAALAPGDSVIGAWRDFGDRAEQHEAWSAARDAWARVAEAARDPLAAERAGAAALESGEPQRALALLDRAAALAVPGRAPDGDAVALRVRALGRLGRAAEAERVLSTATLEPAERARLAALVADAWVRTGDVVRARTALGAASGSADTGESAGWLALYAGDLKQARTLLTRPGAAGGTELAMTALALLGRTRIDSAPAAGAAFLSATRGDTAGAIAAFEQAATAIPEAASLLLSASARLRAARGDDAGAVALWQRIVERDSQSPEAPEADLAWSRALRRRGDATGARARLEHLILTYPASALVPIARRELESPS